MRRPGFLRDRNTELVLGVACLAAAVALIHDAYERRGVHRSFLAAYLLP